MAEYSDLEDAIDEIAGGDRPLKRIKNREREVELQSGNDLLGTVKAKAMLRGLRSSKRGLNLGQIDNDR